MVTLGENGPPEEVPSTPRFDVAYDEASSGTLIGQGGNADVYKITVERPDQAIPLAIKQPRIQQTLTKDIVERFTEETRVWKSLDSHDYIVNIVDADDTPVPWIAMEYMDGGTLESLISEEQLPFSQAVWVGLCVTRAVRHAHRHGVAHHDIKPANVLFRQSDTGWMVPKVSDWGLARMMLEETNSVAGLSPQYAAPEQFDADTYGSPDDQTDIYQLGVLLYELFTGRPPFEGAAASVMQNVLTREPAPPSSVIELSASVDELIMPALEKTKSDRYDSTVYLRDGLEEILSTVAEKSTDGSESISDDTRFTHQSGITPPVKRLESRSAGNDRTQTGQAKFITDKTTNSDNEHGSEANTVSTSNIGSSSRRSLLKYIGLGGMVTGGTALGIWEAFNRFNQGSAEEVTVYTEDDIKVTADINNESNQEVTTETDPAVESGMTARASKTAPNKIDDYLIEGDARLYDRTMADYAALDEFVKEVVIEVGAGDFGFAFAPPAVRINTGTTVVWEWTGEGGAHNVVSEDTSAIQFNSGDPIDEQGYTFEQTFETAGIQLYYCTPHKANGKIGAIDVV